jgi:hypothetical protein
MHDEFDQRPGADAIDDAPTLCLDRRTLAAALGRGDSLWYYSLRTGWLRITFTDPPAVSAADGD